jgi:hypothetical protein
MAYGSQQWREMMKKRTEVRETVLSMLAVRQNVSTPWNDIYLAVPPATLPEKVVNLFSDTTDIPLEIPFFIVLHYLSAFLLQKGVSIQFAGQSIRPDLWTVLLAESGTGKTYAQSCIRKLLGDAVEWFPEPASAAKFVDELALHNRAFWSRDEFAQLLDGIEKQTHMAELKDYLLRTYDGEKIERRTRVAEVTVKDPALTIFGSTVGSTFLKKVSLEMLLDGFAQRFAYVIANPDKTRPPKAILEAMKYPFKYQPVKDAWDQIAQSNIHAEYKTCDAGEEAFISSFRFLLDDGGWKIPMSFFRRILFRGVKYALLYHLILKKQNDILDEQDFGWAGRVCALHLRDVHTLIKMHGGYEDFEQKLRAAKAIVDKKRQQGKEPAARDLISGSRKIKGADEAKDLLSILQE